MWLDLTTTHRQTWLFSSTSTYHSTDLLTARGVAYLVVGRTSGSTSYETIPPFVRLESSGGVLSTVDMVVQRRDGPRRLREHDDDNDVMQQLANFDWHIASRGPSAVAEILEQSTHRHKVATANFICRELHIWSNITPRRCIFQSTKDER